jgi:pimeloyl-ACP methyl ester carboxylesterase
MRIFGVLSFCSLLTFPALAPAAPAASAGTTTAASGATALAALEAPAADRTFTVGTLRVQQYGDRGRPLILIPGLEGGSWVWRNTIENFRGDHVIYALTLAGFDGIPAPKGGGNLFDMADASLLKLIKTRHIKKPVLIGHSLGGTLSIRFAGEHSGLLSGVVAVDGLPVFPGMERLDAARRQAAARQMVQQVTGGSEESYRAGVVWFMQNIGMLDPAQAVRYAALNARSDRDATAKYLTEDAVADYRSGLKNIRVPLLEISPYNAPDFSKPPLMFTEAQKTQYYESLLAGVPHATVVSISPARRSTPRWATHDGVRPRCFPVRAAGGSRQVTAEPSTPRPGAPSSSRTPAWRPR